MQFETKEGEILTLGHSDIVALKSRLKILNFLIVVLIIIMVMFILFLIKTGTITEMGSKLFCR